MDGRVMPQDARLCRLIVRILLQHAVVRVHELRIPEKHILLRDPGDLGFSQRRDVLAARRLPSRARPLAGVWCIVIIASSILHHLRTLLIRLAPVGSVRPEQERKKVSGIPSKFQKAT